MTELTTPLVEALTELAQIEAEIAVINAYAAEVELVDGVGAGLIRAQIDEPARDHVIARARQWAGLPEAA